MKFAREYSKSFKVDKHIAIAFIHAVNDVLMVHYRGHVLEFPLEEEYNEIELGKRILTAYKESKKKNKNK